jgi:SAM-dependent methyltransferase
VTIDPESAGYIHGFDEMSRRRLDDQAASIDELVHHDTVFEPDALVVEFGCATGAQTEVLARRTTRFIALDRSPIMLAEARRRLRIAGLAHVRLVEADATDVPLADASVDHVVIRFLLEHVDDPVGVLRSAWRILRPGGRITVIEGDHGPTSFHPDDDAAHDAIACQVRLQRRLGGDPMIGRRLRPLLMDAGFVDIAVSPRLVHADGSRPALQQSFTLRTFTAMIAGVRSDALDAQLITAERFDAGIAALERTAETDGVFLYLFMKGTAIRPAH